MSLKDSKVLVIGGCGFVGSNLCIELLSNDVKEITVVDNLLSSEIQNLPKSDKIKFVLGSISDDKILYSLDKNYDYIFHLATYHGNQSSMKNPLEDHDNNTITTLKICEYFKNSENLKKLVYASAGCVVAEKTYDKPDATAEDANISLYLDSPYQISKMIGEFYGNYYYLQYKLPFVKARFQNVYGPREMLGAGRWRGTPATVWRNVTPTFVWRALNNLSIRLDNNGNSTRDFIYVSDLVDGLIACALKGQDGGVYNLASGKETTIKTLAETICKYTDSSSELNLQPPRKWDHSGRRFGDPTKAEKEIGFKCSVDFEEGIKKTVEWTKENYDLIKSCIEKHSYFIQ
tara:strand:- start:299 stop:1336 length:1038 start_codon:yes stop_codon:yes gene_type:complete